jgi:protein-disulfide isomerase
MAVRREFFSPADSRLSRSAQPTFEVTWKDALLAGVRVGDSTSRVTIIVFNDLECPACGAFHQTIQQVLAERGWDVSMVFVHFPLTKHRFALPAAQAAECAAAEGRFATFIEVVFAKQDSLGLKSWSSYAREAGVADTAAITRCAHDPTPAKRVEAGRELGLRWRVIGTPTVIVNGHRYASPPTKDEIGRVIREALKNAPGITRRDEPVQPTSPKQLTSKEGT